MTARAELPDTGFPETELPEAGMKPVRSCVGCKARAAKSSLLRLVVAGDVIVPDPRARKPGRGAYLHPSLACLELAQRRRVFSRALRVSGSPSVAELALYLSQAERSTGIGKQDGSTLDMTETCTESRSRSL
jgi:uncharacterized protein